MRNKRGQGVSMNVIIIAIIALLVLVIVSVIFMNQMWRWNLAKDDCKRVKGPDPSNVCCVKL
jgi:hypothetical protein